MSHGGRSKSGNMLAMVAAVAILLIAVLLFGLQYLSVNRGHMEQRTAAEAAALAAAQSIGRIAVNTPEFGWVGLSGIGPVAKQTLANDQWYCEVKSLNEILATARLDYIIAHEQGDKFMEQLALQDVQRALSAKDALYKAINASLVKGGKATDAYGNNISPYDDAEAAYIKNNAKQSTYDAGTLTLEMGSINGGITTSIAVPNPTTKAAVNPNQTENGKYLSDIDLTYNGKDFYFASCGDRASLVDVGKYQASSGGQIPSVVKVEADNTFTNQGQTYKQHFTGCAIPGSDSRHPACGALTVSFPDGQPPEIKTFADLMNSSFDMDKTKCDLLTSKDGDYPIDTGSTISNQLPSGWYSIPATNGSSNTSAIAADMCRVGVYDFLREAGSGVNIDSALTMLKSKFADAPTASWTWKAFDPGNPLSLVSIGSVPGGVAHIYTVNTDGTILYRSKAITPYPYMVAADQQLYSESTSLTGNGISSKAAKWKYTVALTLPDLGSGKDKGDSPPPGGGHGKGSTPPVTSVLGWTLQNVDIEGKQQYDFYMRDMVHQPGSKDGGEHAGEPMDCSLVARAKMRPLYLLTTKPAIIDVNGNARGSSEIDKMTLARAKDYEIGGGSAPGSTSGAGIPNLVSRQDDFASTSTDSTYYQYTDGPDATGSNSRPTYTKNGVSVDIRFRRQVDIGLLSVLFGGFKTGYVGEMVGLP